MSRITVIGGTGYAGSAIARAAAARGHEVRTFSRTAPAEAIEGVEHRTGSFVDEAVAREAIADTDVVVVAVAPSGPMHDELRGAMRRLEELIVQEAPGVRLGAIGGAGTLAASEGGPLFLDTDEFPAQFRPDSLVALSVLEDLRASDERLDWFVLSPASEFGAYAPGEATDTYRTGGDVLLRDDEGRSRLSGADLASAVVDEIERPSHRRERFTAIS